MTTFLLVLLTILGSAGAGYVYGWLTSEDFGNSEDAVDPATEARRVCSDISADVQRAEEQIQRLNRPNPGRRPLP